MGEKRVGERIRKWDEVAGASPSVSRNPLRGVEDQIEQNDNAFDGVINNLPRQDRIQKGNAEVRAEEEKKKSVWKKLQEMNPEPEKWKVKSAAQIACEELERA